MTKAKRRRLALIHVLSDLSRDGWKSARYDDYAPLEKELRKLESEVDE
jgi:hypothetical protein